MTTNSSVDIGSTSQTTVGALTVGSLAAGFTVVTGALGGTGVANTGSTITLGGNFATTGAFSTTLNVTAGTTVTLPTTGTLVNTGVTTLSSLTSVGTIGTGTWQGTVVGSTYGGTGVNNGASTVTLAGNLVTSGANSLTLTTTNTTNVTLPTSGTLSTVSQLVGKNMLINGDMQVWQRGAGGAATFAVPAASNIYTADRWQMQTGANQAFTVSQVAGPTSGSWLVQIQRNAAQTGVAPAPFGQSLTRDMSIGAAGNILTLSFKAKAGATFLSSGGTVSAVIYTGTGTSDISYSSGFTGSAQAINVTPTLSGTLTNFTYSTSALAANITQLAVAFYLVPVGTAGATDSISITDVQLEISTVQSLFDRLPFLVQLLRCQYFYCKSFLYGTAPAQNVGTGTGEEVFTAIGTAAVTNRGPSTKFPIKMRATPTLTTYSTSAASAQIYDITASAVCTSTTQVNLTERAFYLSCTANAGSLPGNSLGFHWQADIDVV